MMRFVMFLSVSVLLFKAISSLLPGEANYTCIRTDDGMNKLIVTYVFGATDPIMSLYVAEMPMAPCRDNKFDAADTFLQLSLMPIDKVNGVCGIKEAAGATPGPLAQDAVFYLTKRTDNLIDVDDYMITIPKDACDFTDFDNKSVILEDIISVTGNLKAGVVGPIVPQVWLKLVNAGNHAVDIQACALGNPVKLKLTMGLIPGGPTGVHALHCTFLSVPPIPGGLLNLIVNSCVPVPPPVGAIAGTGFTYDAALSTPANYVSVMTNKFDCFRFAAAQLITATCTVQFCITPIAPPAPALGNKCQIGADTCAVRLRPRRKRRDINEVYNNDTTVTVTFLIGNFPDSSVNTSNPDSNNVECPINANNKIFIAIVAVLGALLLIAMAATCYLASRLRLFARKVGKGIDNPSFQANKMYY